MALASTPSTSRFYQTRKPLILLASLAAGLASCNMQYSKPAKAEQDFVEPEPIWVLRAKRPPCLEPTSQEVEQAAHALRSFELNRRATPMTIGATSYFSRLRYRRIEGERSREVCPPYDLYPRLAELLVNQNYFGGAYIFKDELGIARMMGPRDPAIVDAVARTAFNPHPIMEDDVLKRDIRPLARSVLAEFGSAASAYGQQAFDQMSGDTALGTGAAQIAVAAGHPGALARTEELMDEILGQFPDTIPRDSRNRIFELAYALAFAGPQARDHLDPVLDILDRRVESWAPPYGMVELEPVAMCLVLERVGGPEAEARLSEPPCNTERRVYSR